MVVNDIIFQVKSNYIRYGVWHHVAYITYSMDICNYTFDRRHIQHHGTVASLQDNPISAISPKWQLLCTFLAGFT